MKEFGKKLKVAQTLEYAAFRDLTLTLQIESDEIQAIFCKVVDIEDATCVLSIGENNLSDSILQKPDSFKWFLNLEYQSHHLRIPIEPSDSFINEKERNLLSFSFPKLCEQSNKRRAHRLSLTEDRKEYQVQITYQNTDGTRHTLSGVANDISSSSLGVNIPRKNGLVLPGEAVERLLIQNEEDIIYEGVSKVQSLRTLKMSNEETGYLSVFEFPHHPDRWVPKAFMEKRSSERINLEHFRGCHISFQHPFFPNQKVIGLLNNVSMSGFSFSIPETKLPHPPGMIVTGATIHLPFSEPIHVNFKIVGSNATFNDYNYHFQIGVKLTSGAPAFSKTVSKLLQNVTNQNIVDAASQDQEQLWELFFDAGFIYQKKRKVIQPFAPKILDTYSRLLKEDTPILKKVLFKEAGRVKGHISSIKFFDECWLGQHLAALKADSSVSAAQDLLRAITHFYQDPNSNRMSKNRYVIFYYRPDSLYPATVYGEAKEFINNPQLCDYEPYYYCLPKETKHLHTLNENPNVREATVDDLLLLEKHLIDHKKFQLIRLEDLTVEKFTNLDISKEYEKLGLYRTRRVLVAEENGIKAFAICNLTSPGMNLSELTNSVRIFYEKENKDLNQKLANALGEKIIELYSKTNMPVPVLLNSPHHVLPKQFESHKLYNYWFLDLNMVSKFHEAIEKVFTDFKKHARKYQQSNKTKDAA